ncbi:MAG: carboxypeptidase regulatory-like domain-containing protein [Bryobacteraceae bacterium]
MSRTRMSFLLCVFALIAVPVFAQIDRGTIKGTVTDPQDAAIAGARVTLNNPATGSNQETTTSSAGSFTFIGLVAGRYTISCEVTGFKKFVQESVTVDVGRTTGVNISLQPGAVYESVTVTEQAPPLDSETSDVGTSMTRRAIIDLPVPLTSDSRNPLSFVILTPGVSGSVPGATPDLRLHVNGTPTGSSEVYIDGVPEADTNLSGNIQANHPSIEAIGEFKTSNSGQTAQYGLASGIFSFTFRSGTNHLHGSLFEYLQNDHLNALDSPTKSIAARNGVEAIKAPLKQNEYGFAVGGPIYVPKVYNGRDKTFFFTNYTGFKYRPSANTNSQTTLPNHLRTGDFSQLLGAQLTAANPGNPSEQLPIFDAAGRPVLTGQIYDPFTVHNVTGPDGKIYPVRDPVPGNIISPSDPHLSQVAKKIGPLFPNATSDALFNNVARQTSQKYDQDKFVIKIDQMIGSRNTLSGSFFRGENNFSNNGFLNDLNASQTQSPSRQYRVNDTFSVTPRVVNTIVAGFLRDQNVTSALSPPPSLSSLGINGIGLPSQANLPSINVIGQNSIGGGQYTAVTQNRFFFNDSVSWNVGSHSLKFGAETRRMQRNEVPGSFASIDFRPAQTGLNGVGFIKTASGPVSVSLPASTGHSVASLLYGAVDYTRFDIGFTTEGYRWRTIGGFVQDDWKVNRSLTLNLGLRYDYADPRREVAGRIATFNPTLPNSAAGGLPGTIDFYGNGPGRNGRDQFGSPNTLAFQPRIGLAYAPAATDGILGFLLGDQKTVFRSNFAITRPLGNDNLNSVLGGGIVAPGFNGVLQVNRPQDAAGSPALYLDNRFPGITPPPTVDPSLFVGNANAPFINSNSGILPTEISWAFGIQRSLPGNLLIESTYVGTHNYHLGFWAKPNQVDPSYLTSLAPAAKAAGLPVNEFLSLSIDDPRVVAAGIRTPWPGFKQTFGAGATVAQALRPFPQTGNIDNPLHPIGSVSYNALQSKIQKRFSQGLTLLLSYTFSKVIGDVDSVDAGFAGAENAIFAASFSQNYYDQRAERSVTSSDIPHVVALSYAYELPFGPGKPLLNKGGVVGKLAGGWEVSAIQLYQSGRPVHIETWAMGSANPLRANDGFSFHADIVPGQPLINPDWNENCSGPVPNAAGRNTCQFYINPAAFRQPAPGTFGNAGKFLSGLRTRPYYNEDISVIKRFKITEGVAFSLQANFFNAFNRVVWGSGGPATFQLSFAPPNLSSTTLANSTSVFGILTNQQNAPRRIQLAARFEF